MAVKNHQAARGERSRITNWAKGAFSVLAGAVILYFVLRSTDWEKAGEAFAQAQWYWLGAALSIMITQLALKGWRLMIIAEGRKHVPGVYIKAIYLGLGGSSFLPLRAGEFLKIAYLMKRAGASILQATFAVVTERILDLLCVCLLVASLFAVEQGLFMLWFEQMRPALEAKAQTVVILGAAGILFLGAALAVWLFDVKGIRSKIASKLRDTAAHLEELKKGGLSRLINSVTLTVIVWSMDTVYLWAMTQGFGLQMPLGNLLFLQVVLTASYASSVSPGALGIYELLGLWALKTLGQPESASLAFLLAAHGATFLVLGVGMLYTLVSEAFQKTNTIPQ